VSPGPRFALALRAGAVFAVFLVLFLLFDRLSRPDRPQTAASPTSRAATQTTTSPTTTTARPTTTVRPTTTTAGPTTTRRPQPTGTTRAPLKSGEGVTIQILNGTGELRLARDFKPLVRRHGYRIVNSGNTGPNYPTSTVYYTGGNRDDALAFQRRFPAFRIVEPAPSNLSRSVELHAIIGANYTPPS
jgi:hypothetical protein